MELADLTTLRLGGLAWNFLEARTEDSLVHAVRTMDEANESVLLLGGGSNVVIADEGFPGSVVAIRTRGVQVEADDCGGVTVTVQAGELWDDLVRRAVSEGWTGIEALSGIPGSVGATPIQNVGAYGQEVSQTIAQVRVFDRRDQEIRTLTWSDCQFAYRSSIFKRNPARHVVLSVTFQFSSGELSRPIAYSELAGHLGVKAGDRVALPDLREAVLQLRRRKGMVLDAEDHDTWSAGSFFTNPILSAEQVAKLPDDAPRFNQPDGCVKSSAAWLIDHAGFTKGYGAGQARLSNKHVLALTNRGAATTNELLALAREIREGVRAVYGIELTPEPVLVGCSL